MENKLPKLLEKAAEKLPYFGEDAKAQIYRMGLANVAILAISKNKHYLVKFAYAPASKPTVFIQSDYEKKISQKISSLGLSPKIAAFGTIIISGRKFPYSIQEFIKGRQFDPDLDLTKIAKTLHALHSKTYGRRSICEYRVDDPISYLHKHLIMDLKRNKKKNPPQILLSNFTKSLLENPKQEIGKSYDCLIHNDLTAENILISGNNAFLIDFGWAMYANASMDLCNLLSPFTTSWTQKKILKSRKAIQFLKKYLKLHAREDREILLENFMANWLPYNSMLANWIYFDFFSKYPSKDKQYFLKADFIKAALGNALDLQNSLEKNHFL